MNTTNRAVNRIVLGVLGVILLAVGAVVIGSAVWPAVADAWRSVGTGLDAWAEAAGDATAIAGTDLTWIAIGGVAALVLIIALLVVVVVGSIHGRRRAPLRATGAVDELGRVTVTEGFASDALEQALAGRDEIISARVSTGEVRREPVLHLSLTLRQHTSPLAVARMTQQLVANLGVLTGRQPTTYISLHSGLRARISREQRRLS